MEDPLQIGGTAADFAVSKQEVFFRTSIGDTDSVRDCNHWDRLVAKMRKMIMAAIDSMLTEPHDPSDPRSPSIYEAYRNSGAEDDDIWQALVATITEVGYFPLWADPRAPKRDAQGNPLFPPYYLFGLNSFLELKWSYRQAIKTRVLNEIGLQRKLKSIVPKALASRTPLRLDSGLEEVYRTMLPCPNCSRKYWTKGTLRRHIARSHGSLPGPRRVGA